MSDTKQLEALRDAAKTRMNNCGPDIGGSYLAILCAAEDAIASLAPTTGSVHWVDYLSITAAEVAPVRFEDRGVLPPVRSIHLLGYALGVFLTLLILSGWGHK